MNEWRVAGVTYYFCEWCDYKTKTITLIVMHEGKFHL
jgi:hypothetical protein